MILPSKQKSKSENSVTSRLAFVNIQNFTNAESTPILILQRFTLRLLVSELQSKLEDCFTDLKKLICLIPSRQVTLRYVTLRYVTVRYATSRHSDSVTSRQDFRTLSCTLLLF